MTNTLFEKFTGIETIVRERLYKAVDQKQQGGEVAIKVWQKERMYGEVERDILRALSEDEVLKGIIPQYMDFSEYGESGCCLARTWLEGITLEEYVKNNGGKLDEAEAVDIIREICAIINILHSLAVPVVMNDLKPSNILIDGEKGQMTIRLIDFETACFVHEEETGDEKHKTMMLGSAFYTAPEVVYGKSQTRSDIYSIGAILSFLLRGRVGYPLGDISLKMRRVISTCMQTDVDARYRDITQLIDELGRNELIKQPVERNIKADTRAWLSKVRQKESRIDYGVLFEEVDRAEKLRPKSNYYKKVLLVVDCNMCFACELAYMAARSFGMTTGIFTLSEEALNKLDYYIDFMKAYSSHVMEDAPFNRVYGRSEYMRSAQEWMRLGLLTECKGINNLYAGSESVFKDTPVDIEGHARLFCNWAYSNFDLTVVVSERNDNREIVSAISNECDYIIATPHPNIDNLELTKEYYGGLERGGVILPGNVRYVAWDYHDKFSMPHDGITKIVGNNYIGAVSYVPERQLCRNRRGKRYCEDAFESIESEYSRIIMNLMQ